MNLEELAMRARGQSQQQTVAQLLDILQPSVIVPQPDKYYVFVYKAKTPNIRYDQFPFIACTSVFQWGFIGYNFHWEESRRYTWAEVKSNLYEVSENELNIVEKLPIAKFKTS